MKMMIIIGTAKESFTIAPFIHRLKEENRIDCVVVNTAEDRDMLDQMLELYSITPDYDCDMFETELPEQKQVGEMMSRLSPIIEHEQPEIVFVHGYTNTSLAGAYSAFMNKVSVAHVDLGITTDQSRSSDEITVQMITRLADLHFVPTEEHRIVAINEHIDPTTIKVIGHSVSDATPVILSTITSKWMASRVVHMSKMSS